MGNTKYRKIERAEDQRRKSDVEPPPSALEQLCPTYRNSPTAEHEGKAPSLTSGSAAPTAPPGAPTTLWEHSDRSEEIWKTANQGI